MLDVVRQGLTRADDVRIAVSFTRCSGLGLLIDPLKDVSARGGRVRLLTSTYQCITQPAALHALRKLGGVETRLQTGSLGFHAKFWWFGEQDGGTCWAGSSNLSKGGLSTNLEWNLRQAAPAVLKQTGQQFDGLWDRPDVHDLTDAILEKYRLLHLTAKAPRPGVLSAAEPQAPVRPNAAQTEALASLASLRARGQRRAAVIAATGVGKTFLAAFDVQQSGVQQALYVSHRLEHLLQARRTFQRVMPERSMGVVGGGLDEPHADMVFVTVASLARRPELLARPFGAVIIDEFHHVEAPSYGVLRDLVDRAFLLGLTATPERQDGHDVLQWCDWNVAYEVRLPEAIDRGWLLPFHYFGIADSSVDFLAVPWRQLYQVEDALSVEERAEMVLQHAIERGFDGPKRATIGFCAGRAHACFMADAFVRRGQTAVAVLGDQPVAEREHIYAQLADLHHPLEWVFVSDILNEGVDIPVVNSVLFLRPTESATLFLQQLGRGLRTHPGTEVLTVLDFVGHHRSAWLTLNALDAPAGGGHRTQVTDDVVIKPPRGCEVVLQRRTQEILAKVKRYTTKKAGCNAAYQRLRAELGRPLLPVDLWHRTDVPPLTDFRQAFRTWAAAQTANQDRPPWADNLPEDHVVHGFLRAVESDWQAQRVTPYALTWGLCARPDAPEDGYEEFFRRWPQWRREHSALDSAKTWSTVRRKLGPSLTHDRLSPQILDALGDGLLAEVEGRLLYTVNRDHQQRHGGVLRTPADLNWLAQYERPEIIRHFGLHYDPARHNTGMLWFDDHGVIITKLDTSTAKRRHQYNNQILDAARFEWTSQNRMNPHNTAGQKVLNHTIDGRTIHLFVQPGAHQRAWYLGTVQVASAAGAGPMKVVFDLDRLMPDDVLHKLMDEDPPD